MKVLSIDWDYFVEENPRLDFCQGALGVPAPAVRTKWLPKVDEEAVTTESGEGAACP